jgi:hypothetical protein
MEPSERIVRVITWIFIVFVVFAAVAIIAVITTSLKATVKARRPGTTWIVAQDIFSDGNYAFKAGESVVIEAIRPYPENPRYKYVVFSQQLQRWFTLSSKDLHRPPPHPPLNPR